jgi:large subunit ribosomal protein L24
MKIKKGDLVLVISGKYRGKKGKVLRALPKENKVVVEGVNLVKKHLKPRSGREKGEIVTIFAPISVSNVKLLCPNCQKPTRIGFKFENGKKVRICKKCQSVI